MVTETSYAAEMVEALSEDCLCEDPLQGYEGEPLVTCTICCRMCSRAAAEAAIEAYEECVHYEQYAYPDEGDTSWLDQYMC